MNIFLREMNANRKSLIIWCVLVIAMVGAGMSKFTAAAASGQSMNELMAQMPKAIQAMMGSGAFDLTKASGFYGMLFLYLLVMATVHAAMLGATIISKEERDKTTEFLLVKPVSRTKIITAKLLAALTNLLVFNLITLLSSLTVVGYYAKGEAVNEGIFILMLAMFILQVLYLLIGTGIAAVSKRPKTAPSVATWLLLATFILSALIDLNANLESLKYLTPFKYFEVKNLMYGGGFEPVFLIISGLTMVMLVSITYSFYQKRDMSI